MKLLRTLLGGVAAAAIATSAHAVVLYQNDFDGNEAAHTGVTGGFSGETTLATATVGAWNADGWAGNHINNSVTGNPGPFTTLSLANLATHSTVSMSFILGLLDSWDGDAGPGIGPDHLEIWIDGAQVADLTTNTGAGSGEDYDGATELYDDIQADTHSFYFSDVLLDASTMSVLTFAHSASTLTLGIRATGGGWQGGTDEAWGLDSVVITYDGVRDPPMGGVPEPATWALMIGGFGLAGTALRRRRALVA